MKPSPLPPGSSLARGFTLIEAVVVVVILAVLTGVIIPRLTSFGSRRTAEAVQRVADVLNAATLRAELSGDRLALEYDADRASLCVQVFTRASPDTRRGAEGWQSSPLIPAITLDGLEVRRASLGMVTLDPRRWRLELGRSQQRPWLRLELGEPGLEEMWTVLLAPSAMRCSVVRPGQPIPESGEVDLDRQGGGGDAW